MPGRQAAYAKQVEAHQRRLYGFFRARVKDDPVARDLVQETWVEVWEHIETYDPDRGSFWTFTKIWAGIVLKRHWEEAARLPVPSGGTTDLFARGRDGRATAEVPQPTADDPAPEHMSSANWRARPIEETIEASQGFFELLRRAASCSRPPHEIVAFGFNKLEWRPREIVEELSDAALRELAARLEREYGDLAPLPTLDAAFGPLRGKMSSALGALIADPRTRRLYEGMLERTVGDTTFREYYPPDSRPEDAVVHWWDAVKRVVLADVIASGRGPLFERLHGRTR